MTRTSRAVVFLGGDAWDVQELPVPDRPSEGAAIMRVEATGMCHSDIDNLHGIVHTPWGGEFPTIPGHEIVGRIEQMGPGAAASLGVSEGDRVAVRAGRVAEGNMHRIYGHDYSTQEGMRSVRRMFGVHGTPPRYLRASPPRRRAGRRS